MPMTKDLQVLRAKFIHLSIEVKKEAVAVVETTSDTSWQVQSKGKGKKGTKSVAVVNPTVFTPPATVLDIETVKQKLLLLWQVQPPNGFPLICTVCGGVLKLE